MRTAILASLLALSTGLSAATPPATPTPEPVDSTRPYLNELRTKGEVKFSDYLQPYLISETAIAVLTPMRELEARLRDHLTSTSLPFKAHFSKTGQPIGKLSPGTLDLPKVAVTGHDLEEIVSCTAAKCQVKLTRKEAGVIEKESTPAAKLSIYQELLCDRIRAFITHDELLGYDERASNQEALSEMVAALPFLKSRYPETARFLSSLLRRAKPPKGIVNSFLRKDLVQINSSRLQPILRLSEVIELRESGSLLFAEIPIYTNHYFDASFRLYEVFPVGGKSALVLTDVMEVDELKKSGIIRALFRGKMEDGVSELESDELQRFR